MDSSVTVAVVVGVVAIVVPVLGLAWQMSRSTRLEVEAKYVRIDLFNSQMKDVGRSLIRIERTLEKKSGDKDDE